MKKIATDLKAMNKIDFEKIATNIDDPIMILLNAYETVINDCKDFPLLVDLLKKRKSIQRNYSLELINAGIFIRLTGGRNLYDFLYKNLPLPSESTINRSISQNEYMTEGKFNDQELEKYIEKYSLQNVPFTAAEDATRCQPGVLFFIFASFTETFCI